VPSEAFRAFVASVQSAPSGRDDLESYDTGALLVLRGDERIQAEKLLLDRIASGTNDPRAPAALLEMRCGGNATDRLNELLPTMEPTETRASVAELLFRLDHHYEAVQSILEIIDLDFSSSRLTHAILRIRDLRHPTVDDDIDMALLRVATGHADELVRINAETALEERNGAEATRRMIAQIGGIQAPSAPPEPVFDAAAFEASLVSAEPTSAEAYALLAKARDEGAVSEDLATAMARAICLDDKDTIVDAGALLARQDLAIRVAFYETVGRCARTWRMLYGDSLRLALEIEEE